MHLYELLCMDFDRSRSILLAHADIIATARFHEMVTEIEDDVLEAENVAVLAERWRAGRLAMREMARVLGADTSIVQRLEAQLVADVVTYSDIIDVVAEELERRFAFYRPPLQASVARLGHAPV